MIDLRKHVFSMLVQKQKIDLVEHFEQETFKRSTIYNITKHYEINFPIEHRSGAGRSPIFSRKEIKTFTKCYCNSCWCQSTKMSKEISCRKNNPS